MKVLSGCGNKATAHGKLSEEVCLGPIFFLPDPAKKLVGRK